MTLRQWIIAPGVVLALLNLGLGLAGEWNEEAVDMAGLLVIFALFCFFTVRFDDRAKQYMKDNDIE